MGRWCGIDNRTVRAPCPLAGEKPDRHRPVTGRVSNSTGADGPTVILVQHADDQPLDALVVGAGFAGLYGRCTSCARKGLSVRVVEGPRPSWAAPGTTNRYIRGRAPV